MATAATIAAKLILDATQFMGALTKAGAAAGTFSSKMQTIGGNLSGAGRAMTMGLTLPLIGIGIAATNASTVFDTQMRNIQSISRQTDDEIADLGQRFITMSTDLTVTRDSAVKLAEAFYFIQSSGFAGEAGMEVLRVSTKAASAGLTDTMVAGNAILATLNAYGLGAEDAAHVSDVLFKTVDLGVLTFSDLASQLGDVVNTAATMKVPIEEVGAAIALLTRKGISAPEAVTALNQLMLQFISPSKKMQEAAEDAGVSLDIETLRTMGLSGALKYLVEKSGDPDIFLKLFGDNVRALKGALALGGDGVTEFSALLEEFADVGFETQNKSHAAQWDNFKNKATAALITVGDVLIPILILIVDKISPIIDSLKSANPEWVKWGVVIGIVVAVLGPLLMLIGGIITAVGVIGSALSAVGLPIILIFLAIAAALYVLYLAWVNNWGGIQEKVAAVWAWLQPILQKVWDWLATNIPIALQILSDVWNSAITFLANLWTNTLWPAIQVVWNWLSTVLFPFFEALGSYLGTVFGLELRILAGIWQNVLWPELQRVWNMLVTNLKPAFEALAIFWDTVLGPVIKTVGGWIQQWLVWSFNNLTNTLKTLTGWLTTFKNYLNSITLPWWMTPKSPTPWEVGLWGVFDALQAVSAKGLPAMTASISGMPAMAPKPMMSNEPASSASSQANNNNQPFDYDRLARILAIEVAKRTG